MIEICSEYINAVREMIKYSPYNEKSFYPIIIDFMKKVAKAFDKKIVITLTSKIGNNVYPDLSVWDADRQLIGHVEVKIYNKSLDFFEKSEQIRKYLSSCSNIILTNMFEYRLYVYGNMQNSFTLSKKGDDIYFNVESVKSLFYDFIFGEQVKKPNNIKDCNQLSFYMSRHTISLKNTFLESNHIDLFDKVSDIEYLNTENKADYLASALSFYLLLKHIVNKSASREIPILLKDFVLFLEDAYTTIIDKGFKELLDKISEVQSFIQNLEVSEVFNVSNRNDFLDNFMSYVNYFIKDYYGKRRYRLGLYGTPNELVDYIVKSTSHILENTFGFAEGLSTEKLKVIDLCAGHGSILSGFIEKYAGGKESHIPSGLLSKKFMGYDINIISYLLSNINIQKRLSNLIYDSGIPIVHVRNALDISIKDVKSNAQTSDDFYIIVCEPPYPNDILQDHFRQYSDDYSFEIDTRIQKSIKTSYYVYFMGLVQRLFREIDQGILVMLVDREYLGDAKYVKMRRSLLETFNEIFILDLNGHKFNDLYNKESGERDEHILSINYVRGLSLAFFIKKSRASSKIFYYSLAGKRKSKLQWLSENSIKTTKFKEIKGLSNNCYFVYKERDKKFLHKYSDWLELNDIFSIHGSCVDKGVSRLLLDSCKDSLLNKITYAFSGELPIDKSIGKYSINPVSFNRAYNEIVKNSSSGLDNWIYEIVRKPFYNNFIFYYKNFILRTNHNISSMFMHYKNLGLVAAAKVSLDQMWRHCIITDKLVFSKVLTEYSRVMPLYRVQDGELVPNIKSIIKCSLEDNYGVSVAYEDILYYMYAVMYAPSYRTNYREYLMTGLPRMPFTADREIFFELVRLGKMLTETHLSKVNYSDKENTYDGIMIGSIRYDNSKRRLYLNNSEYMEDIDKEVMNYKIGCYSVLRSNLKSHLGKVISKSEIQKLANIIQRTISLQEEIEPFYKALEKSQSIIIDVNKVV
jgi:hypothetical protein